MITRHIHDALVQVRHLQHAVLDRQRFKGYSGPARALSGSIALLMAAVMMTSYYPATTRAHVLGWGGVLVLSFVLNFGALIYWFFHDPLVKRDVWRLKPLLDTIPPLFVGGALTFVMLLHGLHHYLFGIWMCMFGLSNIASRYVLPRMITLVGLFYILAGITCLVRPGLSFLNPWPMGMVFCAGEWAGGLVLYLDDKRFVALDGLTRTAAESYED